MVKRLPPLFEAGIYGCPFCGSPDIEFRDFRQEDRTFLIAGQCHGVGEATEAHRWVVMLTMRPNGMRVRIEPLHRDVAFPGRPNDPDSSSRGLVGYLGLQAHGAPQDVVSFRNIRVRDLSAE